MKITVLIENTLTEKTTNTTLKCEHGLSMLIEDKGKQYLLDAGSSGAFFENAALLGISAEKIETAILSHAHYDHADGFTEFFKHNQVATVYAMEQGTRSYYSASGGTMHDIGIREDLLAKYKERFHFIKEQTEIAPGVFLIPHSTAGLSEIGKRMELYRKEKDSYLPDDFSHELSLVLDTEKGLVIFNSCSHGGIINIMEEVKKAFPGKRIYAFLGGLHMKGRKDGEEVCTFRPKEVKEVTDKLAEHGLQKLYTGHCTGTVGAALLKKYMGNRMELLTTGKTILL